MALLLLTLAFFVAAVHANLALDVRKDFAQLQRSNLEVAAARIHEDVQSFHAETGNYPASFSELATRPHYRHLRAYLPANAGGYAPRSRESVSVLRVTSLADSQWRFDRVAVLAPHDGAVAAETLKDTGKCFPGDPATALSNPSSWCGPSQDAVWRVAETRGDIAALRAETYRQLAMTAQRFERAHASASLPLRPADVLLHAVVTPSAPGSQTGSGTASACQGPFHWGNLVLGCTDLYGPSGQAVSYRNEGSGSFTLSVPTGIKRADNTTYVAERTTSLP